jgi:hypothetical protein
MLGVAACRGRGGESPTGPSASRVVAPVPIGYAHVLRLDGARAQEVAEAGGRLVMAELTGSGVAARGSDLGAVRAAADVMRRVGGVLLLAPLNANDTATLQSWSTDAYAAHVRDARAAIGTAAVWCEPVTEPWVDPTGRAMDWFDVGARIWREAGGTVIGPVPHPCRLTDAEARLRSGQLAVLDCTPVLVRALGPADVTRLVGLAVQHRAPLLLYETGAVAWPSHVAGWLQAALREALA